MSDWTTPPEDFLSKSRGYIISENRRPPSGHPAAERHSDQTGQFSARPGVPVRRLHSIAHASSRAPFHPGPHGRDTLSSLQNQTMSRYSPAPSRPRSLLRRRFDTALPPAVVRARLEERVCAETSLPTLFVLPSVRESVRVSGPDLHGDIHVRLAVSQSALAAFTGNTTEVTVDFRAADKATVQALIACFGPELVEAKVRRPRQELMGHTVAGHQPNVGHFLAWACHMPSMADHVILESAIDAGFACDFESFERVHSAMRALDFMRMVRMDGGLGGACEGDEIPPHLRHPHRQGLTGKAAIRVAHQGRKVVLNATIDTRPTPAGDRLRIHYGWSPERERYLIGWVSDLAPKA